MKRLASILLAIILVVTDLTVMAVKAEPQRSNTVKQTESISEEALSEEGAQEGITIPGTRLSLEEGNTEPGTPPSLEEGSTEPGTPPSLEEGNTEPGTPPSLEEGSTEPGTPPSLEEGSTEPGTPPSLEEGSTEPETPPASEEGSTEPGTSGSEETTEEETEMEPEGQVSGNEVEEDSVSMNALLSVSVNLLLDGSEGKGDTLPLDQINFVQTGFPGDMDQPLTGGPYTLPENRQGNAYPPNIERQDWAYALCSALESSYKTYMLKAGKGAEVSFSAEELSDFLYSKSKDKAIDKYGKISGDVVTNGDVKTGNTMSAVWAAATGYAFSNNIYNIDNIRMFNGKERNLIQEAIKKNGEVITSLYFVEKYFRSTGSGEASYYYPEKEAKQGIEHAVTIVGWDNDYKITNFNGQPDQPKQPGAWLVKDAYGHLIGDKPDQHYYWVSYYDKAFMNSSVQSGEQTYSLPLVNFYSIELSDKSKEEHTYQFDGGSGANPYGAEGYTKAVNLFEKASEKEVLQSISFGTLTKNAKYKIQVYLDATAGGGQGLVLERPLFKEPIVTDVIKRRGYYSVDLTKYSQAYMEEPLLQMSSDASSHFAVQVEIITEGTGFVDGDWKYFWVDGSQFQSMLPLETYPEQNAAGQSYVYNSKSKKWIDFGKDNPYWNAYPRGMGSNIRIKAHTKEQVQIAVADNAPSEVWLGQMLTLKAMLGDQVITEGLSWSSDNDAIAAVDASGCVIPKAAGTVRINVEAGENGSGSLSVTVKDIRIATPINLLSNSNMEEKKRGQIKCEVLPAGYKPEKITYKLVDSLDQKYLNVDQDTGSLFANKAGESKENIPVRVVVSGGGKEKEGIAYVNCYQVIEEFEIIDSSHNKVERISLKKGDKQQIFIKIMSPQDARNDILWKTSNPKVVSVTQAGTLIATGLGSAVITAFSENDSTIQQKLTVNVVEKQGSIALNKSYLSLEPGSAEVISVKFIPEQKGAAELKWSILDASGTPLELDNKYISFDTRTGTVTAKDIDGTVTLIAESGEMRDSCYIRVKPRITSMSLSFSEEAVETERTVIYPKNQGKDIQLYAIDRQSGKVISDTRIFFRSENTAIADVTEDGRVQPHSTGAVTITATLDSGITSSVSLKINSEYDKRNITMISDRQVIYWNGAGANANLKYSQLRVLVDNVEVLPAGFLWESSDPSKVKVDVNGRVEALSVGQVRITAKDKLQSTNRAGFDLEVKALAESVQPDSTYMELAKGRTVYPGYTILPANAANRTVTLSSNNVNVVSVNGGGISAVSEGTAKIRLISSDGVEGAVSVKVMPGEAAQLTASMDKAYMERGFITNTGTSDSIAQITVQALDAQGGSEGISRIFQYTSQNPYIASVDQSGKVTGYSEGSTEIQIKSKDGGQAGTRITIVVQKAVSPVKSIILNYNKRDLRPLENFQLSASLMPEIYNGDIPVKWSSSNENVAAVSEGGFVTSQGIGTAVITAWTVDGSKKAECLVNVYPADKKVKLFKLSNQTLESYDKNPKSCYQIEMIASDGWDYRKYCLYSSSNPEVCTVSQTGLVSPAVGGKAGKSTITAIMKGDPAKRKQSFVVQVVSAPQTASIQLWADTSAGQQQLSAEKILYLKSQPQKTFNITAYAFDGKGNYMTDIPLKWSVSDTGAASIKGGKGQNAILTLKRGGSFTITCTAADAKKYSTSALIYSCDAVPALEAKNLAVNLAQNGDIKLPLKIMKGSTITDISLSYVQKGKEYFEDGGFLLYRGSGTDTSCYLSYKAPELSKGNYVIWAEVSIAFDNTDAGRGLQSAYGGSKTLKERIVIPVNVSLSLPKIKVTAPQINIFNKNSTQKLNIETGETVESITLSDSNGIKVTDKFLINKSGTGYTITAITKEKGNFEGILNIKCKGYPNALSLKCKIKTIEKKPRLTVLPSALYAFKASDMNAEGVTFQLQNEEINELVSSQNGYIISGDAQFGLSGNIIQADSSALNKHGRQTLKVTVSNPQKWNSGLLLQVPVILEKETSIKVEADRKKILLNKKGKSDYCDVIFTVKQQNLNVSSITNIIFTGKRDLLVDFFNYDLTEGQNGKIRVRIKEGMECPEGNYKLKVDVKVSNNKVIIKEIPITVESSLQSARITLKGSINPLDRANTKVEGKVEILHASADIVSVAAERSEFVPQFDKKTNSLILKLKEDADISGKNQTVILRITLGDGSIVKKAVTVKIKESKLKWSSLKPFSLSKHSGSQVIADISQSLPEAQAQKAFSITLVGIPEGLNAYVSGKNIIIGPASYSIKPGKYKIQALVKFKDSSKDSEAVLREVLVEVRE